MDATDAQSDNPITLFRFSFLSCKLSVKVSFQSLVIISSKKVFRFSVQKKAQKNSKRSIKTQKASKGLDRTQLEEEDDELFSAL